MNDASVGERLGQHEIAWYRGGPHVEDQVVAAGQDTREAPMSQGQPRAGEGGLLQVPEHLRPGAPALWLLALVVVADLTIVLATTSWLALLITLVQLPMILGVAVLHSRRCAALSSTTGLLEEVGTHAEEVEAALSRDEETLHEVRATIVGLSLAVHLLAEAEDELPEATRLRLETLHGAELERLERLLTEAPREEPASVPLSEVVDPFVDSVRARGQRVRWSGTGCRVWGRRDEIAEIVHVLLENAARHAPGSEVAVEVSAHRDAVQVRVADHGPGIPPALAPTVFERGVRGADSPGQGIGLHVAQRLSREMGGDLCLEPPVPGAGAAFALTLPVDRAPRDEPRDEVA